MTPIAASQRCERLVASETLDGSEQRLAILVGVGWLSRGGDQSGGVRQPDHGIRQPLGGPEQPNERAALVFVGDALERHLVLDERRHLPQRDIGVGSGSELVEVIDQSGPGGVRQRLDALGRDARLGDADACQPGAQRRNPHQSRFRFVSSSQAVT